VKGRTIRAVCNNRTVNPKNRILTLQFGEQHIYFRNNIKYENETMKIQNHRSTGLVPSSD
jgi:hypothetical protein